MALDEDTHFNIRTDGNDTNGAGFADLDPGTSVDYSKQAAAQLSLTDLAMVNGGTTLTSAAGGFTAAMVGNCIYIRSGTNFVSDYYQITGLNSATSVEIDRDATSGGNGSSGAGRVGGGRKTITDSFLEYIDDRNIIWLKKGTYTLIHNLSILNSGSHTKPRRLFGYNSDYNDYPRGDNRPLIVAGSYILSFPTYWILTCLRITTSHADGVKFTGESTLIVNTDITQSAAAGNGITMVSATYGGRIMDCWVWNTHGTPTGVGIHCDGKNVIITCCKIWGFDIGVDIDKDACIIDGSIIYDCDTSGVDLAADRAYLRWNTIYGCPVGVEGNTEVNTHIRNCILANCSSFGARWTGTQVVFTDYNCFDSNGTDLSGIGVEDGSHNIVADPLFVDAGAGNFALQAASPCIQSGARVRLGVG